MIIKIAKTYLNNKEKTMWVLKLHELCHRGLIEKNPFFSPKL